jgi:hypothetical protein
MIYYSYVHSILSYGIISWGNSHLSNSIFKIQKRIIRVITSSGRYYLCWDLFKKLQISPLQSQHMFSLLVFVIKNKSYFTSHSDIHDINTCYNYNLQLLSRNLTLVQKGVLLSGSMIYNNLPLNIKMHSKGIKHFKSSSTHYFTEHALYSIEEHCQTVSYKNKNKFRGL